tara:strand:- start:165 stop:422 length:258 start_codon:yes stop_codon:yes gene_type:complete
VRERANFHNDGKAQLLAMLGYLGYGDGHVWKAKTLGGSRAAHKKSRQKGGCAKRKPSPSHRANAVLNGLSAKAAYIIVAPLSLTE